MSVVKRTCSFDEDAWAYARQRAKRRKKSGSAVVSELLLEQRRVEARTRVLEEYGKEADLSDEALASRSRAPWSPSFGEERGAGCSTSAPPKR